MFRYALGTHGSSDFAEAILNASADGIVVVDAQGIVVRCNPRAEELLGRSAEELLGENFGTVSNPNASGGAADIRVLHRDGSSRVVEVRTAETSWKGSPVLVVTLRDITERLEAQEQRERLLSIIDATPSLVGISDRNGRVLYLNRAGRALVGLEPAGKLPDLHAEDLHPAWAAQRIQQEGIPRALQEGSWQGESALRGPEGREIPVWQIVLAHPGSDGRVAYLSTVAQDLSRWKAAEAALAERVKELRTLYGASRELARSDLRLEERLSRLVGILPPGWLHPSLTEARIQWRDRSFATHSFQETPWMLTSPILADDREVGRIQVALTRECEDQEEGEGPFLAEERELLDAVSAAISEAVERERLQQEFVQAQKMETIGRLAGGTAHDFNNLLSVIQAHADAALASLPPDSPESDDISRILAATFQGTSLTNQLLTFSRKQVLEEELVRLPDRLEGLQPTLRRLIPARIHLEVEADPDAPTVRLDASKLDQVVLNLVINAVDAIQNEGVMTLSLEERVLTDVEVGSRSGDPSPGRYAQLTVRDSGAGMPPEVTERIFEPFFTTKAEGHGTGLGLSMVFGFVRQSRGYIQVDSAPGEGSSVRLLFPAVAGSDADAPHPSEAEAAPDAVPAPEASLAGLRVLVVDDNDGMRTALRRMLSRSGIQVQEAASGREALEMEREALEAIDVLLTDLVMPSMSGVQLARELKALHPGLRIILMSGYALRELHAAATEGEALNPEFLSKPFTLDEAREALLRVLA